MLQLRKANKTLRSALQLAERNVKSPSASHQAKFSATRELLARSINAADEAVCQAEALAKPYNDDDVRVGNLGKTLTTTNNY
jgi:hypothetical protein